MLIQQARLQTQPSLELACLQSQILQAVLVQEKWVDWPDSVNDRVGNILLSLNRHGEGLEAFQKAIRIRPDYHEAHANLGNLHREARFPDLAEASMLEAIQMTYVTHPTLIARFPGGRMLAFRWVMIPGNEAARDGRYVGITTVTEAQWQALARAMGRRDCLGATMAIRRDMLTRVGGLAALKDHLADDNVLGQLVRRDA